MATSPGDLAVWAPFPRRARSRFARGCASTATGGAPLPGWPPRPRPHRGTG